MRLMYLRCACMCGATAAGGHATETRSGRAAPAAAGRLVLKLGTAGWVPATVYTGGGRLGVGQSGEDQLWAVALAGA